MSSKDSKENTKIYIEYMPLMALKPAIRNPKKHDKENISESMKRFGYTLPMMINEKDKRLVAGHGRRDALIEKLQNGEEPPERVFVDNNGEWLVPVLRGVSFKDADEAESYLLADNQLTINGQWMEDELVKIKDRLSKLGKLQGTGFDVSESLKNSMEKLKSAIKTDSDIEELKPKERSSVLPTDTYNAKFGQIWALESEKTGKTHFILFGDSTKHLSAFNKTFHGVFTSPPYAEQRKNTYGGIPVDKYVGWWQKIQEQVKTVLLKDGSFFVNIKPHSEEGERSLYVADLLIAMKREFGWKFIDELIWNRTNPMPGAVVNKLKNAFEPIYHFGKQTNILIFPENAAIQEIGDAQQKVVERYGANGIRAKIDDEDVSSYRREMSTGSGYNVNKVKMAESTERLGGVLPSNVITMPTNSDSWSTWHPATFPVALPEFFIKVYSQEGARWLDPFVGSGSTIIACDNTERIGYGVEINVKDYGDKILNYMAYKGFKPTLWSDSDDTGIKEKDV